MAGREHGTKRRRSWRKLHIGMDANTGEIVAATPTTNDVDDASQVDPLLDQMEGSVASFTADGAYDQDRVYQTVTNRDPDAEVIVPPRATAVLSKTAETKPTQRDRHLQFIPRTGRQCWQSYKQVIGDSLRFCKDERRATKVAVAIRALNRMLELGRPISVRIK